MAQILVVDDEPEICTLMRRTLEEAGHVVDVAHDGAVALGMCRVSTPDLMILDLFMPRCDGIETMIALNRAAIGVKLIVISGGGLWESSRFLKIADMLGAARVLAKPVPLGVLVDAVDGLLAPGDADSGMAVDTHTRERTNDSNGQSAAPAASCRQVIL